MESFFFPPPRTGLVMLLAILLTKPFFLAEASSVPLLSGSSMASETFSPAGQSLPLIRL